VKEKWHYCPFCGEDLSKTVSDGRERMYCVSEERFIYDNPVPAATAIVRLSSS